jgi:hypothetical protein
MDEEIQISTGNIVVHMSHCMASALRDRMYGNGESLDGMVRIAFRVLSIFAATRAAYTTLTSMVRVMKNLVVCAFHFGILLLIAVSWSCKFQDLLVGAISEHTGLRVEAWALRLKAWFEESLALNFQ